MEPGTKDDYEVAKLGLRERLTKGLLDFSTHLADVQASALVQMWMPDKLSDGSTVLSAQGLPFALSGVGDLLALFRCVSVRYRFATDVNKPALMGAPGRVFASLEPEMTGNVQKYAKQVYLRVTEAQRCQVYSVLVVPVFDMRAPGRPLAVFELVQGERDVAFPAVMAGLKRALDSVFLSTTDVELHALAISLRSVPRNGLEGPQQQQQQQQQEAGKQQRSSCQIQKQAEDSFGSVAGSSEQRSKANNNKRLGDRLGDSNQEQVLLESSITDVSQGYRHAPLPLDSSVHASQDRTHAASNRKDGPVHGGLSQDHRAGVPSIPQPTQPPQSPQPPRGSMGASHQQHLSATPSGHETRNKPGSRAGQGGTSQAVLSRDAQALQLLSWMNQNGLGQEAVMKAIMTHKDGKSGSLKARTASPTPSAAQQQRHQQQQEEEEDEIGMSSDDDGDEDSRSSKARDSNRVAGGAGKRLRFEDLQAQFGLGLKEAAHNLGICATTLKRACRRHGIRRWPRRQIAKLNKALTQMGGLPPKALAQSAAATAQAQQSKQPTPTPALPLSCIRPPHPPQPPPSRTMPPPQQLGAFGAAHGPHTLQQTATDHTTDQAISMHLGSSSLPLMGNGPLSGHLGIDPGAQLSPFSVHHQLQLQQQQQQQQGASVPMRLSSSLSSIPSRSYSEMDLQFLYSGGSLHQGTAYASANNGALINELGPLPYGAMQRLPSQPGSLPHEMSGTVSMQMSQHNSLLLPMVIKHSAAQVDQFHFSDDNLACAGLNAPAPKADNPCDASAHTSINKTKSHDIEGQAHHQGSGDGTGEAFLQDGHSSHAEYSQLAAIHELFQTAPGSLESVMELLIDDQMPHLA